jgi:hypothetical protein
MKDKNENNKNHSAKDRKQEAKKKGGPVNIESTPVTDKVKPKAGGTLRNEGTNIAYEEER